MSQISECHKTLVHGVGKCSVPMWCNGMPAGFCDEPAYGPQAPRPRWDTLPRPYAPALACPAHGGPIGCPAGCSGIDLGDGNHSGCECHGAICDCPQHPAPSPPKET